MSEQQAEQTSIETGSVNIAPAVPASPEVTGEAMTASAQEPATIDSPKLASEPGEAGDAPNAEAAAAEAAKVESAKPEAPRPPGKLMIMSPGDRTWHDKAASTNPEAEQGSDIFGKRRMSAMAAVVALATMAGALGGALATSGLQHLFAGAPAVAKSTVLETAVARLDADILALKASVEQTSRAGITQFNKTGDRLDKVEKAQAEPLAKLARLSEAVEKLRAAQPAPAPVAAAPAAAKEVTGSLAPPVAQTSVAPPKTEVARLPTVEGWVLRDVSDGGALIEGRQGIYEVYSGDAVPGLGRVDAVRKQDGRWVVVTSRGLIVGR